jgi:hypothetical protein
VPSDQPRVASTYQEYLHGGTSGPAALSQFRAAGIESMPNTRPRRPPLGQIGVDNCSVVLAQRTAFFTRAAIFASSAAVNFVSAYAIGHMEPASSLALSLKPNIEYRSLNFPALRK